MQRPVAALEQPRSQAFLQQLDVVIELRRRDIEFRRERFHRARFAAQEGQDSQPQRVRDRLQRLQVGDDPHLLGDPVEFGAVGLGHLPPGGYLKFLDLKFIEWIVAREEEVVKRY